MTSDQPRKPSGTPAGGEFDRKAGSAPSSGLAVEIADLDDEPVFDDDVDDMPDAASPSDERSFVTADDGDFEFARPSEVGNMGEDIKGSARHRWHRWNGLDAAEADGTAAEAVTRDMLLKNEPHRLSEMMDAHPLTAMSMHLALKRFPAKPKYGRGDEDAQREYRAEFVAEYLAIRDEAERLAAECDNPAEAVERLNQFVVSRVRSRRSAHYHDPVANDLVSMHHALRRKYMSRPEKSGVHASLQEFVRLADGKTPDEIREAASAIINGSSIPAAFGASKKQTGRFNPVEQYVAHAERHGGRDLTAITSDPKRAMRHLLDAHGVRGVQWGNTVTDDERAHHAARLVEAFDDLGSVTGLPPHLVGLGGRLGLAVGARGKGAALATYERGTRAINLTRKRGVGALAHEWAHGLDHALGEHFRGGLDMATERPVPLYEYTTPGGGTRGLYTEEAAAQARSEGHAVRELDRPKTRRALHAAVEASTPFVRRLDGVLRQMRRSGEMSDRAAAEWGSAPERFARIVERSVQHRLNTAGRSNTYLAGVDDHPLWPTDEEVAAMQPAMDSLFAALADEGV